MKTKKDIFITRVKFTISFFIVFFVGVFLAGLMLGVGDHL